MELKKKNKPVKDFGNDPFFVKKAQEMKELIRKVGLPEDFKKSSRRDSLGVTTK